MLTLWVCVCQRIRVKRPFRFRLFPQTPKQTQQNEMKPQSKAKFADAKLNCLLVWGLIKANWSWKSPSSYLQRFYHCTHVAQRCSSYHRWHKLYKQTSSSSKLHVMIAEGRSRSSWIYLSIQLLANGLERKYLKISFSWVFLFNYAGWRDLERKLNFAAQN